MKTLLLALSLAAAGVSAVNAQVYQPAVVNGSILGGIAGAIIGGAIAVWMLRAQAIDEWRGQMKNYSLVLSSHTTQTLASANLVLDGVSQRIQLAGVTNEAGLRAKKKPPNFIR